MHDKIHYTLQLIYCNSFEENDLWMQLRKFPLTSKYLCILNNICCQVVLAQPKNTEFLM